MKSFLRRLLGGSARKHANPLTAWPQDLADLDDIDAIKFARQKLIKSIEDDALDIEQKYDLLIEVETLNRPRLEKLSRHLAKVTNMKPELENSISESCYNYCRMSYICHLKVIEWVMKPGQTQFTPDRQVLIIARALNAAFNMIKWRLFVQQNPPTNVWLQIYILYKVAAEQKLMGIPVELFSLDAPTTLSAFIVQVCMLGQLLSVNMQKYHLEIATKVLRAWLTRAHISSHHTPENYLFYIDLGLDLPAKRIRKITPDGEYRFWELDDFEKQLVVAITVTDRGEMPESLIFLKIDQVNKLNETLLLLHAEWRKNDYIRQRRKETREAISNSAKVTAGIHEICNQVLHTNQVNSGLRLSREGKTIEDLARGHTALKQTGTITVNSGSLDTWIITDKSASGLGARVNKFANILARPNKLIALVLDDEPGHIIVGMIRGVKSTQGNQLKVGIEVLSHKPVRVQMKEAEEDGQFAQPLNRTNENTRQETIIDTGLFPALYLPIDSGQTSQAYLIMPKLNFRPNQRFVIYLQGKAKRVALTMPVESQDDWVKVVATNQ